MERTGGGGGKTDNLDFLGHEVIAWNILGNFFGEQMELSSYVVSLMLGLPCVVKAVGVLASGLSLFDSLLYCSYCCRAQRVFCFVCGSVFLFFALRPCVCVCLACSCRNQLVDDTKYSLRNLIAEERMSSKYACTTIRTT